MTKIMEIKNIKIKMYPKQIRVKYSYIQKDDPSISMITALYRHNILVCYLREFDIIYYVCYFILSMLAVFMPPFTCVLLFNLLKKNKVLMLILINIGSSLYFVSNNHKLKTFLLCFVTHHDYYLQLQLYKLYLSI